MFEQYGANIIAWMAQSLILASAGALLPLFFGIRHPRTQLAYCHALTAVCLVWPLIAPRQHPVITIHRTYEEPRSQTSRRVILPAEAPAPSRSAPPATQSRKPFEPMRIPTNWRINLVWIAIAGAFLRLSWLLANLWLIRRRRIGSTPLYPVPESLKAAAAITNTDALFCVSTELKGPVMLGWLTPVVLLPESFHSLDEDAQCAVATHELLHVKRQDWIITLIEELAACLCWFNPAIWYVLANARLAREEVVDAEVVRLIDTRDTYIQALLSIARARPSLDLAPAPLFLRRRHLTQRVDSLLREVSVSNFRLSASYTAIAALVCCAAWFAVASSPLLGESQVVTVGELVQAPAPPVPATPQRIQPPAIRTGVKVSPVQTPADPHEPVTGGVHVAATPADRAAALALLERALQPSKLHLPDTPPFRFDVSFTAEGQARQTGAGQLTEIWFSGQRWRWTANVGGVSVVRINGGGLRVDAQPASEIPMRAQMLRNAILVGIERTPSDQQIRTADVQWNGRPVTCILTSLVSGPAAQSASRLWEEQEHCIDPASGTLQVHSIAPGTYTVYGYSRNLDFHSRPLPDHITIYVGGTLVADANFSITDATSADENLLQITPDMARGGRIITTGQSIRFPIDIAGGSTTGVVQPVIVHAEIDPDGNPIEAEISAASDPALAQRALELVKAGHFAPQGNAQRQAYINVRFLPQ